MLVPRVGRHAATHAWLEEIDEGGARPSSVAVQVAPWSGTAWDDSAAVTYTAEKHEYSSHDDRDVAAAGRDGGGGTHSGDTAGESTAGGDTAGGETSNGGTAGGGTARSGTAGGEIVGGGVSGVGMGGVGGFGGSGTGDTLSLAQYLSELGGDSAKGAPPLWDHLAIEDPAAARYTKAGGGGAGETVVGGGGVDGSAFEDVHGHPVGISEQEAARRWRVLRGGGAAAGPGRYCSPRHRMPRNKDMMVQNTLDVVASNTCQALPVGDGAAAAAACAWPSAAGAGGPRVIPSCVTSAVVVPGVLLAPQPASSDSHAHRGRQGRILACHSSTA